jgi:hypothetical protein
MRSWMTSKLNENSIIPPKIKRVDYVSKFTLCHYILQDVTKSSEQPTNWIMLNLTGRWLYFDADHENGQLASSGE